MKGQRRPANERSSPQRFVPPEELLDMIAGDGQNFGK